MRTIATSIFELFKTGPGPSSSHTIGPMAAACAFAARLDTLAPAILDQARAVEVRLLGSLAATGRGHGTVRAVLAGLLGHQPHNCPPDVLDTMTGFTGATLNLAGHAIPLTEACVVFDELVLPKRHPNTLRFSLLGQGNAPLYSREAYSVGGGFVEWEDQEPSARPQPAYPFGSMNELLSILDRTGLTLPEVIMANETAMTGLAPKDIATRIEDVMRAMEDAVERGLEATGPLPGPLGLNRKAKALFARYTTDPAMPDKPILALCACAFAASEENAAGHVIVTAPTAGGSGVLAAVLYYTKNLRPVPGVFKKDLQAGMMAAALVGLLAKHNASVSGAEVGCQGEVGVASAMAAAFLCQIHRLPANIVANAAETALEHHLGLTCDPVQGFVQIPCIERNAMGAVKAFAAYQIAATEDSSHHLVGLDEAIRAMADTGRDMNAKYKETAQGGLAAHIRC